MLWILILIYAFGGWLVVSAIATIGYVIWRIHYSATGASAYLAHRRG